VWVAVNSGGSGISASETSCGDDEDDDELMTSIVSGYKLKLQLFELSRVSTSLIHSDSKASTL
jgi:hypothetical protein